MKWNNIWTFLTAPWTINILQELVESKLYWGPEMAIICLKFQVTYDIFHAQLPPLLLGYKSHFSLLYLELRLISLPYCKTLFIKVPSTKIFFTIFTSLMNNFLFNTCITDSDPQYHRWADHWMSLEVCHQQLHASKSTRSEHLANEDWTGVWVLFWPALFMLLRVSHPHHGQSALRPMAVHSSGQWITPIVLLKQIASGCLYLSCHLSHLRFLYPGFNFLPQSISFPFTYPRTLFLSRDHFPDEECNVCYIQEYSWTPHQGSRQGCVEASLGIGLFFSSFWEFPLFSASLEGNFTEGSKIVCPLSLQLSIPI